METAATIFGTLLGVGRFSRNAIVRSLCYGYVELFRNIPLLVQIFLLYYGLPGLGITLSREWSAFLALGLNSGAYQAEYLRGSILAIGQGQMMAARAVGMSKWQAVFNIILPQALRLAIPAWANEPVSLLKSTAVVFLIAVPELMAKAKAIAARTYDPIGSYIAVALVYLAMVYLLDLFLKWMERAAVIPGFEMEGKKA